MILWCNCPTGACHVVLDKHRFATLHAVDVDPLVLFWLPAKKDELPCPEKRSDCLLEKYQPNLSFLNKVTSRCVNRPSN